MWVWGQELQVTPSPHPRTQAPASMAEVELSPEQILVELYVLRIVL